MRAPEFWYPENGRMSIAAVVLSPLAWLYSLAGRLRFIVTRAKPLDVPVICIGNLTAGGTGKTPCCLMVESIVSDLGRTTTFLTRGYGGSEKGPIQVDATLHSAQQVGDESLLLAARCATFVSSDRFKGAQAASNTGATTIIMDDGYQNPSTAKAVSILVIDGLIGFGNRCVIPAGPMRERVDFGLRRADAVIVMGGMKQLPERDRQTLENCGIEIFDATIFPSAIKHGSDNDDSGALTSRPYVAFAGIGRPQKFFDTLGTLDLSVIEAVPYPDHYRYTLRDIDWLSELADERNAKLITTEKDFVRLPLNFRSRVCTLPISIKMENESEFCTFLQTKLDGYVTNQDSGSR